MEVRLTAVYDFTVKNNIGEEVSLSAYCGKALLVVNTATKCGLTPQYTALEVLYKKYQDRGFEILDFPCNQFLGQAPGSDDEINEFCAVKYGATFPRFAKIEVNGENAGPLFVWLKEQGPEDKDAADSKGLLGAIQQFVTKAKPNDIKWNFGKFLIDRNGQVHARYSPAFTPKKLEVDIESLL
jgi:glutathione peroxidase